MDFIAGIIIGRKMPGLVQPSRVWPLSLRQQSTIDGYWIACVSLLSLTPIECIAMDPLGGIIGLCRSVCLLVSRCTAAFHLYQR
jgi:hypothetical protein